MLGGDQRRVGSLGEHLVGRGWSDADIHAVLGGNFFRVAHQAWRA